MPQGFVNRDACSASRLENWDALCAIAPDGQRESIGEMLQRFQQYLLLIANQELDEDLKAKAGASDLVQETLLEAHKDLGRFSGTSNELLAWLRRILLNRIAKLRRQYRQTAKRNVARECVGQETSIDFLDRLFDSDATSPSGHAIRREEGELLDRALARLSEAHRAVLTLRHREQLTFEQIGRRMNRSADAARMLWWRAFERLAGDLERSDAIP